MAPPPNLHAQRCPSCAGKDAWRGRAAGALGLVLSFAASRAVADPGTATAAASSTAAATPTVPRTIESRPRPEPPPVAIPVQRELNAADVAGAPLPGDESGRTDPIDDGDSALRQGLRGVLFLPRLAANVVLSPVRLGAWAYGRYHLNDLYYRVFYNDDRTIGLTPTGSFESGFGINGGAQFATDNLLGKAEQLTLEATAGGRFHQAYKARIRSGRWLGDRLGVELAGQYELRPRDTFFGIGDNEDSARPAAPVDPRIDPTAVETRYRERIARVASVIDVGLHDSLHLRSSSELTDRVFSRSDVGVPITSVYDRAALVGYEGVRYLYSELELRLDSRGRATLFEPRPFYAVGTLAAVFAGRIHRLDDAPDYWRYGIDLQHFLRIAEGPRVLALRLRGEAVSGSLAEVPFTELPQLGGPDELRGYPTDRFRDRVSTVGSIEYEWDLSAILAASVFVDTGRVFGSLDDLGVSHLRTGYGVALQGHTEASFGFRASLASSVDGGLFLSLSLNQVFSLDERVRRR